jgi:hypothetical protein
MLVLQFYKEEMNYVLLPQKAAVTYRHTGTVSCVQCAATFVYFQEIKVFTGKLSKVYY